MTEDLVPEAAEREEELPSPYLPVVLLCLGIVLVVVGFMIYWTITA